MQTQRTHCEGTRAGSPRLGRAHEEGQSIAELALVLPMLLAILAGTVEFGRLAYAAIGVATAARAGVAYGAQSTTTAADITGMETAATNDGSDITGWKSVGLNATASESCTCTNGTVITCANAAANCISPARVVSYVTVNTTATIDPLFYVPGLPKSYSLSGQATMRVE